ncbi:MAG: LytR/AlgR family response regulator transcription factor [Oliverpabstia sp.]
MYLAICDDQAEELELLTNLLNQWQEERKTVLPFKTYRSAAELLSAASTEPFTLYFLDVMMPGTDGMAAAREIRSFDDVADIVFLTSSPGFAYESYGVRAMDYLLKPVRAKMLFPILDRIFLREKKPQEGLTLKIGATLIRIPFFQLAYVEVIGKHLYFNLADGSVREIFGSLKDYEPLLLSRPEFMRTHRSYIVNMLQVSELSPAGVRTFQGKQLPVSRLLYPQLQKDYMQLMFAERGESL